MKISHLLEDEAPKKPTKTKTKTGPDLSAFKQQQDQPIQRVEPAKDEPKAEPQQGTPAMPRASQADTLRATAGIQPNQRMGDLLSRMRDIQSDDEDEGYPEQETGTDLTIRSSQDLPKMVGRAMSTAGFENPNWHTVANLPGNMGAGIRKLGKELFKSFTRTPTNDITMIGNVMGGGPNSNAEVNAVAKWLMTNGEEVSKGNIDFEDSIPGYNANILMFDAAGARFLVVKDEFGRYIYTWPQQDSVGAPQQTQQLGRDVPRLNEEGDEVIDRPPTRTPQREEVPVHMPGGSTVVIFNDGKTPAEVVVEAIVAATGLDPNEAFARMMRAHQGGWAPVAAYASRDMAETKAEQIMQHARSNTNYDHYRQHPALRGFNGPWQLHSEVMSSDDNG